MIKTDTSYWPLVISAVEDSVTPENYLENLAEWTSWMERDQPFLLFRTFSTPSALSHPEGVAKEAKIWFQQNSDRIKRLVIGMATVVPSECYEQVKKMNAEKLFGVPAQTFAELEDAQKWIIELASENGMEINFTKAFGSLS